MITQLKNLKKYLIENSIKTLDNIQDEHIKEEILDIASSQNSKTFNPNILIKLLLENSTFFCKCNSSLRKYDHNLKSFRNTCKFCKTHVTSEKIKSTRLKEKIFYGDTLSKSQIIDKINSINLDSYLSSGKQRKFIKEYPQLYFSILNYTKDINDLKGVSIRARIEMLKTNKHLCSCGKIVRSFDNYSLKFYPCCKLCTPKKNSLEYYKLFYPNNFEEIYTKDRLKRKQVAKGMHSLEWYIKKHGEIIGEIKFKEHCDLMLTSPKRKSYSKISLSLFQNIINYGYSEAEFATHPKEKMFELDDEYSIKLNQNRIFVDFVYKNKIIEFQGNYWHEKTKKKDNIRKEFLKKIGYDVLFIYENEYKEDNIRELKKCLRFLEGNKIQNRFKILTESGYSSFDNIVKLPKSKTIIFTLEDNTTIEVSENHKFVKRQKEYIAKDLKIGETLQTKDSYLKITNIKFNENVVYDVLETQDHTYYANDVLNHNCEFLGSSYTLISANALEKMHHGDIQEIRDGKLKIYEYPKNGHQYIMSVDPAKDGTDNFAVQIVDITDFNFEQVASAKLQIDYLLMPEFIYEWCNFYNNPYLIIENNEGAGQSIADQLYQSYEYENLHFDKDVGRNNKKKYPGFRTTTKTRKQILQTLKLFIENDKLKVQDKSTINEFFQFILLNNKFQADDGAKDDMIMSLALIFVPFCNTKNFEDMKVLVKNLYNDDLNESEKVDFTELLTIGNFDSGTDEEYIDYKNKEYETIEEALYNYDGFI